MLIKKLSEEEYNKLNLKPQGKKHWVRQAIENLEPNEAIRISHEAFTWKNKTPTVFCNQIARTTKKHFEVFTEASNTAWVVRRIG